MDYSSKPTEVARRNAPSPVRAVVCIPKAEANRYRVGVDALGASEGWYAEVTGP